MENSDTTGARINNQLGTQLESLSEQIQTNVLRAEKSWAEWAKTMKDRSSECAQKVDEFAHEKPWPMLGIAFVIGAAAGMCVGRR